MTQYLEFKKKLATSNIAESLASAATKAAASDLDKTAITSAKTVGKELAISLISTAKDLAIQKGRQLIDKASSKLLTTANAEVIKKLTGLEPNTPAQKSKDILASIINNGAAEATTNTNKLMMGQGMKASNDIRIQDLVRQTNAIESGLRLA